MRNRIFALIISLVTLISILSGSINVLADANTAGDANNIVGGIMAYKAGSSANAQNWINNGLKNTAGTSAEWYILGLAQSGNYDFSAYESALKNYLSNNEVYSATSRQKYALVLIAIGSTDSYISSVLEDSIGNQGIMSWVYGLHLLNNGYTSSKATIASAKQTLLSMQLSDGGWALSGSNADVDVTSMTIQSLAPYYYSDGSVKSAIDRAISLLSSRQLETGAFSSYGVPNPESTAQVLTALAAVGIDGLNDSRFIKNGNTLLDGINQFKLSDGSFCHKLGEGSNDTATMQVFYSMIAYLRMYKGQGNLYILDKRNPSALIPTVTKAPDNDVVTPTEDTSSSSGTGTGNSQGQTGNQNNSGTGSNQGSSDSSSDTDDEVSGTIVTNSPEASLNPTQSPEPTEGNTPEVSAMETEESVSPSVDKITDTEIPAADIDSTDTKGDNQQKTSYKLWVSLGIIGTAILTSIIMFIKGKKNKKNFIFIALIAVVLIAIVGMTDFQSAASYYGNEATTKTDVIGSVSLSIRCDTIVGKKDSEYIPKDGIILDTTEFDIQNGDTVYDILVEAAKKYGIQMENSGSAGMVYISGINYLYEFDFGDLSGWMYFVNDKEPSVGCDAYELKSGDKIEWLYTCELGDDLK